jgi:ADP-ribosylglycohydrolase
MALMLARALVKHRRYDRGEVLDAYLHWWPLAWDRGGTLRAALGPAVSGKTTAERLQLVEQLANPQSQANGSLMRISPLGIFTASRPEQAAELARQDSRLTHPHPVCQDCCAVFVTAIAHAVGQGSSTEGAYAAGLAEARKPEVQDGVRKAMEAARHSAPADYVTQMGWVLIALQNAFYQLLHASSLEEGIADTIGRGGDTDTTAAIAGALLGAVHGRDAVPARWVEALRACRPDESSGTRHPMPPEFWPADVLEVAEALLTAGQAARS